MLCNSSVGLGKTDDTLTELLKESSVWLICLLLSADKCSSQLCFNSFHCACSWSSVQTFSDTKESGGMLTAMLWSCFFSE